jgi:hypothetical protein
LNVEPDAPPAPPLLNVNELGVLAVTVPEPPSEIDVPFTVNDALANLACANVPDEMLVALIEVTLAPDPLSVPMKLPAEVLPVTANELSVPTEVMLGCAAVVTVPAVVADVAVGTVPVTLTVTAPVAPLTAMFVPATILVTPVLVIVTPVLPL